MQRGLDAEQATSMIVNGFCSQVFKELPLEFSVEAVKLLEKIPETPETRRVLAIARLENVGDIDLELTELIEKVKIDEGGFEKLIKNFIK